jgi:hypothetical protein
MEDVDERDFRQILGFIHVLSTRDYSEVLVES